MVMITSICSRYIDTENDKGMLMCVCICACEWLACVCMCLFVGVYPRRWKQAESGHSTSFTFDLYSLISDQTISQTQRTFSESFGRHRGRNNVRIETKPRISHDTWSRWRNILESSMGNTDGYMSQGLGLYTWLHPNITTVRGYVKKNVFFDLCVTISFFKTAAVF